MRLKPVAQNQVTPKSSHWILTTTLRGGQSRQAFCRREHKVSKGSGPKASPMRRWLKSGLNPYFPSIRVVDTFPPASALTLRRRALLSSGQNGRKQSRAGQGRQRRGEGISTAARHPAPRVTRCSAPAPLSPRGGPSFHPKLVSGNGRGTREPFSPVRRVPQVGGRKGEWTILPTGWGRKEKCEGEEDRTGGEPSLVAKALVVLRGRQWEV